MVANLLRIAARVAHKVQCELVNESHGLSHVYVPVLNEEGEYERVRAGSVRSEDGRATFVPGFERVPPLDSSKIHELEQAAEKVWAAGKFPSKETV